MWGHFSTYISSEGSDFNLLWNFLGFSFGGEGEVEEEAQITILVPRKSALMKKLDSGGWNLRVFPIPI